MDLITIDGSFGEGGGQILRSSLTLSLITGKPFYIYNIRANRPKGGGLRKQHLTAVMAAAEISGAIVEGATPASRELRFAPQAIKAGKYHFDIETAGSTTLVLQTVMLPLMLADGESEVVVCGGTHNSAAPPYEYIEHVFLPLLERMGATVSLKLDRHGFYPEGGGQISAVVSPAVLKPIDIGGKLRVKRISGVAKLSKLPDNIAKREIDAVNRALPAKAKDFSVEFCDAAGPGNAILVQVESPEMIEIFTGFGEIKTSAERVAKKAINEAKKYIKSRVLVGEHLADQLIIPFCMAGGGSFETCELSMHTKTNIEVARMFLPSDISIEEISGGNQKLSFSRGS